MVMVIFIDHFGHFGCVLVFCTAATNTTELVYILVLKILNEGPTTFMFQMKGWFCFRSRCFNMVAVD